MQLAREKDQLMYPADDLVDASMLPLIRPDVSKLTAENLKLLDRTALDVFESTLRANTAKSALPTMLKASQDRKVLVRYFSKLF